MDMDMFQLCRSCMKKVESWEREYYNTKTVKMFCFCTNIKISEDDKMPKQFCYDCVKKVESSFTYISKAQEVDVILKNIYETSNVIVKSEICEAKLDHSFNDQKQIFFHNNLDRDINLKIESKETPKKGTDYLDTGQVLNMKENIKSHLHKKKESQKQTGINVAKVKKKHKCSICKKQFMSMTWFSKHMNNDHNGHNNYVCEHCNKIFLKRWELIQHSACHTEERNYACPECGKRFKRRNQVVAHAKCHKDWRPFECDNCGMKFKFKSALQVHMLVHNGQRPYLCYLCGSNFTRAGTLTTHMRKHTGHKPYSCKECTFQCTVASSLKRHERIHTHANIYVCKHCSKGFCDNSSLIRHVRIHTGELPYKCPHCTRSFIDGWKRKTHLMRAHHYDLDSIPPMKRNGTLKQ